MAQAPRRDVRRDGSDMIEERLHEAAENGRAALRETGQRLREAGEAEQSVLGLWLDAGREQMQHNLETWQSLGSVRDLHSLIELQTEYVRQSLSRLNQLLARQSEVAAGLTGIAGEPPRRNA